MPTTNVTILAPEIAAHLAVADDIKVNDLIVLTDYRGREIGARVTHVMNDTIVARVCGLTAPRPYQIGDQIARDRQFVRRAY